MKLILTIIILCSFNFFAHTTDVSNIEASPKLINNNEAHLFVVSGVVVNSNSSKKVEKFIQMIATKSGYKLTPFYVNSYARLSDVLRKNPDALAWTCGAPYVEDHIKDGQQLIAVPLFNGVPTYSSFIVSKKSAQGEKLTDFKNKIFVYSDPRSNSGFVAPSSLLKSSGFTMDNFFRVKIHAGVHEKSIEAIYKGVADVGAIDEYVWFEYIKTRPHIAKALHVIEKVGPYPFTPIVAGKNVSNNTIQTLQQALVNLTSQERTLLQQDFTMDGFVVKNDAFYLPIKENMIAIGINLSATSK